MSAWARPGVKCVCILEGALPESAVGTAPIWEPTIGETYTIRSVEEVGGMLGLELEEQFEPMWVYSIRRFRPLITQSDDVSLFTHHLDGLPIRENA